MLIIKDLGLTHYQDTFNAMKTFTAARDEKTADEIWLTEHYPVFTQGQAGKPEHILMPSDIPIIQSDRGGQVTFHAPGQLVVYFLVDIRRRDCDVRSMVSHLENIVIETLADFKLKAYADPKAPGVYIDGLKPRQKIASLGLRIRQGRSYHGLALNVAMDLTPFQWINPCGYEGLSMTQIRDFIPDIHLTDVKNQIRINLKKHFAP